jgi:hypothetical protein
VFVSNTTVKNCGGDGIALNQASTGQLKAVIERSAFVECGNGIHAINGPLTLATAANCDFSLNSGNGVFADSVTGGGAAVIRVQRSQISGNGGSGVQAGKGGDAGTSVVEISQDQIDFNLGTGALVSTGGSIETFTNNSIKGNGTNGCSGCTAVGPGN